MKLVIFILVLSLVLLSGCLDIITTRQKHLCLSATDYSTTSIYECSKISECFKKVDSSGIVVSEKLPFEIKNKLLTYKNNVATSIYYFNKSSKELQRIYEFCYDSKDIGIIDSVNYLFFYISRVFNYQDKAWQNSVEILKDYTIFLKNNGIEKITEEELYFDFVLLNKNLNELRDENISGNTYISELKNEAKNARDLAGQFGFLKSYMSNINYVDIFAYYNDYIDNPDQELKIPLISKTNNFVLSKLSTIENFRKIDDYLEKIDNYNLYILFDKHIGTKDSLFKKFILLNNKINNDIDRTFVNILNLEAEIEKNKVYLPTESLEEYEIYKYRYKNEELGFGYYLAKLKNWALEIEENKIANIKEDSLLNSKLMECQEIIASAKKYDNLYFKEIINNFDISDNILTKLEYCKTLKAALAEKDCFSDYKKLIDAGYLEEIEDVDELYCTDLLNQLNYNLINNEKIQYYFDQVLKGNLLIKTLEINAYKTENDFAIIGYKEQLERLAQKPNYKIVLDIDNLIYELNKINSELYGFWINFLSRNSENRFEIIQNNGNYYLVLNNPGSFEITDFCFAPNNLTISQITSLDSRLTLAKTEICVDLLTVGKNQFKIGYKNEQTISTKVVTLSLDNSLLETTVKNTVIGIKSTLFLGQVDIIDGQNYFIYPDGKVEFVTAKENKILYYSKLLEYSIIKKEIVSDLIENKTTTIYKIKNLSETEVCGNLTLSNCDNCLVKITEEDTEIFANNYGGYGDIRADICINPNHEKMIELQTISDISHIYSEMQNILIRINALNTCEFEEVSQKSKPMFAEIANLLSSKDEYSFDEINRVFSLENELNNLEQEYNNKIKLIDNINSIIAEILQYKLSPEQEKEIQIIESAMYESPETAYRNAILLTQKIKNQEASALFSEKEEFKAKIEKLITVGRAAEAIDETTIATLENLEYSEEGIKFVEELEKEVILKLKEKKNLADNYFEYFAKIDKREIQAIIEEVEWAYADITLGELYSVKYYPSITAEDATRLKKKLNYLDTVSFKKEVYEFSELPNDAGTLDALNNIDLVSLERLKDLNSEIVLLTNGLAKFKTDAEKELNDKTTLKYTTDETLSAIKTKFEHKRYLEVIRDIRLLKLSSKMPEKINYQLLVILGTIIIAIIVGMFFGKKTTKISNEEKKQRILRHY